MYVGWGMRSPLFTEQSNMVKQHNPIKMYRQRRKGGADARRLETKFTVGPWPPGKKWRAQSLTVRERRRSVLWRLDEAEAHLAWN